MIGQQQAQAHFNQRNESLQHTSGASQSSAPQQAVQTVSESEQRDVAVVAVLGYN